MRRRLADHRQAVSPLHVRVRNLVRRMRIGASAGADVFWRVLGYDPGDGGAEDAEVEIFGGIGITARPPSGSRPEAIVLTVGGVRHRVIIATRDEDTRQAVVAQAGLEPDELIVFTSKAMFKITAAGEVLIGAPGGEFKEVALADHKHPLPTIVGQAEYGTLGADETGASDSNSVLVKVQ